MAARRVKDKSRKIYTDFRMEFCIFCRGRITAVRIFLIITAITGTGVRYCFLYVVTYHCFHYHLPCCHQILDVEGTAWRRVTLLHFSLLCEPLSDIVFELVGPLSIAAGCVGSVIIGVELLGADWVELHAFLRGYLSVFAMNLFRDFVWHVSICRSGRYWSRRIPVHHSLWVWWQTIVVTICFLSTYCGGT